MLRNPTFSYKHELQADEIENLRYAAKYLSNGSYGEFAARIGDAMLVADPVNLDRLSRCFSHLVQLAFDPMDVGHS